MSDELISPEALICQMTSEELLELLEDMEIEATLDSASAIRDLVKDTGSLEAAIVALSQLENDRRAA